MKKLGFGCMRLPLSNPDDPTSVDYKQTSEMFDYYLDHGYTYFDTAYVYHGRKGEEAVRECLVKRHPRESFTVTTKLFLKELNTIQDAEDQINNQLSNLGVDYIDYYWLHAIARDKMPIIDSLNLFEFLNKVKTEGKVKHIGFSFHDDAELLDKLLTDHPEVEFVQLQINYLDWESLNIQSKACYDVCVKHNKPVIVMEPVKGGTLAKVTKEAEDKFKAYNKDASIASWALKFVANLDNIYMILSGMSNIDQVIDNVNTFDNMTKLTEEEAKIIEENTLIIKKNNTIPCTACRYCVEGCPMNICIPNYFELVNNKAIKDKYQALLDKGFGKASDCIECGQCESICPQHLTIRDYLKDYVVKEYE